MYPQNQQQGYPYPQQQGYPYPQQQGAYAYQPTGQTGGPNVTMNMGQPASAGMFGGGGAPGPGWSMPGGDFSGLFAEKQIRQNFVAKVFSIVGIQLLFTSIVIALMILNEKSKIYFKDKGAGYLLVALIVLVVTLLVLSCVESARRSTPLNFILLSLMTGAYSIVAGVYSCQYSTNIVLAAFAATAGSVLLLGIFAKTTSFDMTGCGTTLCLLGLAHMIMGFIIIIFFGPKASLLLAIAGAALVSLYLVFDLQLIMGGRKCELDPEEYIMAAVMLYTDIIQMFIYMLQIIGRLSED